MKNLALCWIILSFASCNKLYDRWFDHDNSRSTCNIKNLEMVDGNSNTSNFANFFYNSRGLPDSIINLYDESHPDIGNHNHYFTYDNKYRLITHKVGSIIDTYKYEGNSKYPLSVINVDPNLERTIEKRLVFDT